MTVRSTVLVAQQISAPGPTVMYTSPTGFRTIVKSIYFERSAGSAGEVIIRVVRPTVAQVEIFQSTAARAAAVGASNIWVMMHPTDQLVSSATGGSLWVWISGTQLPI